MAQWHSIHPTMKQKNDHIGVCSDLNVGRVLSKKIFEMQKMANLKIGAWDSLYRYLSAISL